MRIIFSWAVLFGLSFASSAMAAGYQGKCEKFAAPLGGGYCVHIPTKGGSQDIVYYLHGSGGNENIWQDDWFYTRQIRDEWSAQQAEMPIVVSVSFGAHWLLAAKNSSPTSGLLEIFTQTIIPSVEASLGGLKGRRIVVGDSMGGFNSIQLALKTDLFAKAAILCAPMSEVSPFAEKEAIDAYVRKSSAWAYYKDSDPALVLSSVQQIVDLAQTFYPSPGEWVEGDPIALAAKKLSSYPQLYVAVGFYDRFVAYEGNEQFVSLLKSHGASVEWRPQWGGHCSMDIPSLAKFLVE